jgi:low affinity Fe/Cu permease
MKKTTEGSRKTLMERFASAATQATGSTVAFFIALAIIIVWGITGPIFHFSETWQLVINTGTTIITFLMVFIIQKSQNKESLAVQLKLNEIIAAHTSASNRLIDVESLTEAELKTIHDYYCVLKEKAGKEDNLQTSHSVEEAAENHELKMQSKNKIEK